MSRTAIPNRAYLHCKSKGASAIGVFVCSFGDVGDVGLGVMMVVVVLVMLMLVSLVVIVLCRGGGGGGGSGGGGGGDDCDGGGDGDDCDGSDGGYDDGAACGAASSMGTIHGPIKRGHRGIVSPSSRAVVRERGASQDFSALGAIDTR